MSPIRIRETEMDDEIAKAVVAHTNPVNEQISTLLTWAADEHVLLAVAAAAWLISRGMQPPARKAATHLLANAAATAAVPHVIKNAFDQRRPDRTTIIGHVKGIPLSGRTLDAFPSGHAMHMGALASAAQGFKEPWNRLVPAAAVGLCATRILLLAHWTSDVIAGFAGGVLIERFLRRLTGYRSHDNT